MSALLQNIIQIVAAFGIALGYSIIYNIPKKYVALGTLVGAVSKLMLYYMTLSDAIGQFIPTLLTTMVVTILAHIFAKTGKTATTIFMAPGVMSLAPGGASYDCIQAFISGDTEMGWDKLGEVAAVAGAIALGIFVIDLIFTAATNSKKRKLQRKAQAAAAAGNVAAEEEIEEKEIDEELDS